MKFNKKKFTSSAFLVIKNKYFLTFLGFIIWMSFFDKNDFLTTHAYQKKLDKLNAEKAYYEEEITKNTTYLNRLETNPENLEKFAREKYLMKRDSEDIFVVVNQEVQQ